MREHGIPGLFVSVVRDGRCLTATGLGVKRTDRAGPATGRTCFHMASVTKTLTATAVLRLVQDGALDLDEPIVGYLEDFRMSDPRHREVTARHLLEHVAAIPDAEDLEFHEPQFDARALERYIASLEEKELLAEPGERHEYTDVAFDLLGRLISVLSGISYEQFVTRRLLRPLGMTDSTLCYRTVAAERRAAPHVWRDGELTPWDLYPYNRRHAPSSALCTSARDMSRWMLMHLGNGAIHGRTYLAPEFHEVLWTHTRSTHGYFWTEICAGFFGGEHEGIRFLGHEGSDPGFRAIMTLLPDRAMGLTIAANMDGDCLKDLVTVLLNLLLD